MKVSIIGMGQVGATLAYTLMLKSVCQQMVLVNRNPEKAEGEARDLRDARLFIESTVDITTGGDTIVSQQDATAGSDVIVMTASRPWKDGFKDRLDAARINAELMRELIPALAEVSPDAILLMISNPVDVLTYHALKLSGFPATRCFGTGTLVDSARFRARLSDEVRIHPSDLHAYILGEHGDSQFPAMSTAQAGGERIEDRPDRRELFGRAMRGGMEVFTRKNHTNFAVAMAATHIISSVARDACHVMPVSVLIDGFLGVNDVCLSLPAIIGREGVVQTLKPELNNEETMGFLQSAKIVREAIAASG